MAAGDLMAQLGLSPSTMAGILKRLELKDLIVRRPDPRDARRICRSFTPVTFLEEK